MSSRAGRLAPLGLAVAGLAAASVAAAAPFDHWQHRALFVQCGTCHAGAARAGAALLPAPADCTACHDGVVEERVDWTPRTGPAPSNLRFTHDAHRGEFRRTHADSLLDCTACHSDEPARPERMKVVRSPVGNCLACHGVRTAHFDAPDSACATCHLPFWEATGVPAARIARWEAPASHAAADFGGAAHGRLAVREGDPTGVSSSCATCHARNYCSACHVNAPETPAIMALQRDPRARAVAVKPSYPEPASHRTAGFVTTHGRGLSPSDAKRDCTTCHAQESCAACHLAAPRTVQAIPAWNRSIDRAPGVRVERRRPLAHGADFTDGHGALAASSAQRCAGCHTLEQCTQCHRPNASAQAGYHPGDYLARHPVSAYGQETSCADCHNTSQFCQDCHARSGLVSRAALGTRGSFHDAKGAFIAGHGVAARQSLESCVSCHAERDCLTCHAAIGGRRFNPHGPDFDAERLRKKNSQMCTACHGTAIPGG